ncbi:MAG: hypothetical protein ABSD74_07875 [Rhizomicrobium sp.]|jgi:hypothetical protein
MMKSFLMASAGALVVAATALSFGSSASAQVGVSVGLPGVHVGVGVPAYYYGEGYYPPGPCDAYNTYTDGDCGYPVYTGDIDFDGTVVSGPHYYRWADGHPYFWYRGGWHNWDGWNRVGFNWDHREGWGWHNGHFDRDWGRGHYRP